MCTLPGIAESTYRMCYKGELPSVPFIRHKGLPCISTTDKSKIQNRQMDQDKYRLKRVSQKVPQPPPVPAPVQTRPKSGTKIRNKVIDTKFGPMDMQTIEKLYKKYRYTTFAQQVGAECDVQYVKPDPPISLEPRADMIRLNAKRYEPRCEEWQDAVLWDRLQTRLPTNRPKTPHKEKLLTRRQVANCLDEARQCKIKSLVRTDGLANVFVRKCPRFAGYNPLCPPETNLSDKKSPQMSSSTVMSVSYGKFPDKIYKSQDYARQGTFSKTVTLTYPFNPFNKVGEEVNPEKRGLYSPDEAFMGLIG